MILLYKSWYGCLNSYSFFHVVSSSKWQMKVIKHTVSVLSPKRIVALVIEFHSLINSYHTIKMKVYFKALTHYARNCKDFPKRIREKIVTHIKNS